MAYVAQTGDGVQDLMVMACCGDDHVHHGCAAVLSLRVGAHTVVILIAVVVVVVVEVWPEGCGHS